MTNKLVTIPGAKVKDHTREKYPFRNLAKHEIDKLIVLYDRHNGNLTAVSNDPDTPFRTRHQLHHYKKLYDFDTLLSQFRKSLIEDYKKHKIDILSRAKVQIIDQAMRLIQTRQIEVLSKITGEKFDVTVDPTAKDLEIAYKIIKTELGEPVNISKTEVDNNLKLPFGSGIKVIFKDYSNEDIPEQDL
jgi:hypothetical protein